MLANISISDLTSIVIMLTEVITLCYVIFSDRNNRRK